MLDDRRTNNPVRARAVGELASEALLGRVEELARRWAIALILARPLEQLSELPLEDLAREAPSLCAQALRAVQSDAELERLTGRGASSGREHGAAARRLATVSGACEPAALIEAVEALRGVLWEALLDQLEEPSARLLADVGDRLAYVCAAICAAGVETVAPGAGARVPRTDVETDPHAQVAHGLARASQPRDEVLIIDERAPVGERAPVALSESPVEIEIRDERREQGPAAWISSIGAQLERFERDSVPFAVLLVELIDVERLRRQRPPEELARLADALEHALAATLGSWSGSLARERPGRCWLLALETDRAGAGRLAQRLMRELPVLSGERRAPLAVAIGTAVCPEDGREPAALAAHADIGLYAARSALRAPFARTGAPVDESA